MAYVFKVFTYIWQKLHYPQLWKELLAEVPGCDKPHEYSYAQRVIGVEADHETLETFFFYNDHSILCLSPLKF